MNKNTDNRYFRTSSFYLSAFLFTKDQTLVDIDKTSDDKRAQFVFLDSPEMLSLIQYFNYAKEDAPEVMVDPRKFVIAIKTFKDKIYQERF